MDLEEANLECPRMSLEHPKLPGSDKSSEPGRLARIMTSHSSHESHARGLLGYRTELELSIEDFG
jgi:hypothetical protein